MVAEPALTPVTTPVALTLATAALLVLHTPPADVSVRVPVAVTQMAVVPPMVPGLATGLTVIDDVELAVPQLLLTE
jgi:hypothetical protein